jgi:hypothetical protein
MRPEDVVLAPAAQLSAHENGISLSDLRHARATSGLYYRHPDHPDDTDHWLMVMGETPEGVRVRILCGPGLELVSAVTRLDE